MTTSTALRSRLQLALLSSRQKQKSLLHKGFTLVELMIVVVIVGILSAVALPNFLSQSNKARATEGKTQVSAVLKQAGTIYAEYGGITAAACTDIGTAIAAANSAVTGKYTLAASPACEANATDLTIAATGATTNYPTVTGKITFASGVIDLQ